jgi:hypothetical protein
VILVIQSDPHLHLVQRAEDEDRQRDSRAAQLERFFEQRDAYHRDLLRRAALRERDRAVAVRVG